MKTTSLADVITKNNRYEKIAANGISIARTFFQDHGGGVYVYCRTAANRDFMYDSGY